MTKRASLLSLVVVASALVACSAILGLQEPTVDNSLGDGSSGGDGSGTCTKDCLGGACVNGQCQPVMLAQNQGQPCFVAQYGSNVYWSNLGGNTVGSADKYDASNAILGSNAVIDQPFGLTADDSGVYVANSGGSGTVLRCAFTGCSSASILFDAGFYNSDISVNGGYVYFLQSQGDELDRIPINGGDAQAIAAPQIGGFDNLLARMTTDGTNVYWSEPDNDQIMRKPISGGNPTAIYTFSAGSSPIPLINDGTQLYFATAGGSNSSGTVMYGSFAGSGGPQTLAASQKYPWAIAVDATDVYWTTEGDFDGSGNPMGKTGGVFRCAKTGCGGNPTQLVSGLVDTRGIAVDDTAIYFATFATGNGDGTIWRLAK